MDNILILIFQIVTLIFSVIVHEVSHGITALKLGDPTAKLAGRLTLNPIKHLDPMGSFLVPMLFILMNSPIMIGWARPVPYNPILLIKDMKYGPLKVALSGPFSNLVLAIAFGIIIRVFYGFFDPVTIFLLGIIVYINSLLFIFNLLPIPPLDGSKILTVILPPQYARRIQYIGLEGLLIIFLFLWLFGNFIFYLAQSLFMLLVGEQAFNVFFAFMVS